MALSAPPPHQVYNTLPLGHAVEVGTAVHGDAQVRKDTVLPEMERASGAPCVAGFDNTATKCFIQPFHYATQPDLALVGQRAAEIAVREIDGEVATPCR